MEALKEAVASRRTNVLIEQDIREALNTLGFNYQQTRVGASDSIKCYVHPNYLNSSNPKIRSEWSLDKEPFTTIDFDRY